MDRNFSRRAFNGALAATALGSLSLFAGAAGAQTVEELKKKGKLTVGMLVDFCLLYTSPSPRDVEESRMPSSA